MPPQCSLSRTPTAVQAGLLQRRRSEKTRVVITPLRKIPRKNGRRSSCRLHPLYSPHRVMSKKTKTKGKSTRLLMREPRPMAVSGAIKRDTLRQHKEANEVPKKPSLSLHRPDKEFVIGWPTPAAHSAVLSGPRPAQQLASFPSITTASTERMSNSLARLAIQCFSHW